MDCEAKDLDADDDAPEVAGEEGDVEEGGGGEAEHERGEGVEEEEAERVADEIAGDLAVPGGGAEGGAVEDAGLGAVDQHGPEAELADDFVQRPFADEEFFRHVGEAVESRAEEGEEVALELVAAGDVAAVGAGDVVATQEDAHAADADENTDDLGDVVADSEHEKGEDDDDDDGPEVDQLRAKDGGVAVGEDGEVVSFHVHEGEEEV